MFERTIRGWRDSLEDSAGRIGLQIALALTLAAVAVGAIGWFMAALFLFLDRRMETELAALLTGGALVVLALAAAVPMSRRHAPPEPKVEEKPPSEGLIAGLTASNIVSLIPIIISRPRLAALAAAAVGLYFGLDHMRAQTTDPSTGALPPPGRDSH